MSMLEYFFSNQYAGYSRYFEGLQIWKSEKYRELQGSYPVIFISFASVKGATYQDARIGDYQNFQGIYFFRSEQSGNCDYRFQEI